MAFDAVVDTEVKQSRLEDAGKPATGGVAPHDTKT